MDLPTIGTVYLNVANLERLVTFYTDVIGMQLQQHEGDTAYLGVGAEPLLALQERPDFRRVPGSTGLYHFAILVPSRAALSRSLHRLIATNYQLGGGSDHAVSEALYLSDPEGNGIEIYRDRPRSDWYDAQGNFLLTTKRLDYQGILDETSGQPEDWPGLEAGTIMGHIHLHVADLAASEAYYCDGLGLDMMMNMPGMGALFMAYGGYHHHVGANIWAGRKPAPAESLGLDKFILRLPDPAWLESVLKQFDQAGLSLINQGTDVLVEDPSKIRILLRA